MKGRKKRRRGERKRGRIGKGEMEVRYGKVLILYVKWHNIT